MDTNEIARGLSLGLCAGILLFYSVRTDVPYASWVVKAYDEPLVRMLLFTAIFIVSFWDVSIAILFALIIMFLHTDVMILGCKKAPSKPKTENFAVKSDYGAPVSVEFEKHLVEGTVVDSIFYPLTDPAEKAQLGGPAPLDEAF